MILLAWFCAYALHLGVCEAFRNLQVRFFWHMLHFKPCTYLVKVHSLSVVRFTLYQIRQRMWTMWIENENNASLAHSSQSTSMHYLEVLLVYACFVFLHLPWFAHEDLTYSKYQLKLFFGFYPTQCNLQYLDYTVMLDFFFCISSNLCMCMPACLFVSVLLSLLICGGGVGQSTSMILHSYDFALQNE